MRERGTRTHYVYTVPSKKAIQSIKDAVRDKTSRSTLHSSLAELLRSLGRTLQGWANYFRHGVSKAVFNAIDSHVGSRIATWIRRKHNRIGWKQLRRKFCDRGWRFADQGTGVHRRRNPLPLPLPRQHHHDPLGAQTNSAIG
jgi:RNA-directed DNA polymerase